MRIVIDARQSGQSTGRYVDKLIEHLHALKPAHEFIILTRPDRIKYFKTIAPTFPAQPTTYKEYSFGEQLGFMRQIMKLKPDLVHFAMTQQPILYPGRVVTTIHDLTTARFRNPSKNPIVFTIKQWVYIVVIHIAARKSKRVITPTEYVKRDVAQYTSVDPRKITVTLESADKITEKPQPYPGLQGREYIMYVGRPQPHKNLWRLIEAFQIVQKTHPELRLALAGKKDPSYAQIEQKANSHNVRNLIFLDFVSENILFWLYKHTLAYVVPSLSEGFGLPGLEAMLHSTPVISSNYTCLPEVYGDGALYFDPLDITDMAAKITEVVDSEKLRQKLIAAGQEQAAKYSWDRMARQTLKVYETALEA